MKIDGVFQFRAVERRVVKFDYPRGATPIDDISGLIPEWVRTQQDLNLVEAENISQAARKYLSGNIGLPQKWFTVRFLQKVHLNMLGEVWDWAGRFRTTNTIPGVVPYRIRSDLEGLCAEVSYWSSNAVELTLLEQAARIHHRLVFIHPFPNGNGRFSRLVADRFLKACRLSSPQWPLVFWLCIPV
ncbi:mobile mystery protein B [Candidatus Pacearchaeota archaeon]|nr:mobile mystery protein B [Candidatus Pacearchaeota archaeon]